MKTAAPKKKVALKIAALESKVAPYCAPGGSCDGTLIDTGMGYFDLGFGGFWIQTWECQGQLAAVADY